MEIGSRKRLDELDSLRGLAALSVVLHHFKLLWLEDAVPGWTPHLKRVVDFLLLPVTAGHEAVILFFILSGFVLSIPAIKSRAQTYPVFVVRRIFRIYFPYVAALVLALLGSMFFYGDVTRSRCMGDFWQFPIDWNSFAQHLIFLGQYDTDRFDPPIWSLVNEMRISLIFPFLCAIALRLRPGRSLILAACISGVLMITVNRFPSQGDDQSFLATLHYAALFVVGIYLARERGHIAERFARFSRRRKIELAVISALLYIFGAMVWGGIVHKFTGYGVDNSADWITAFGATGVIVFGLNSGWCRRFLLMTPVHALGKMSYSVYLLHFIVVLMFVHLLYGKLPLVAIFAICLFVTLVASWIFYRCVEIPSINLGRKLSGYV